MLTETHSEGDSGGNDTGFLDLRVFNKLPPPSKRDNIDDEGVLRERIRTLWNICGKQREFDSTPYVQESRRLEQQYVLELKRFEIHQYKARLAKINTYEASLKESENFGLEGRKLHTEGDYVDGFRIGASRIKFPSLESINAELGRVRSVKQALKSAIHELCTVEAINKISDPPVHPGSDYISMWCASASHYAFGKPHAVHAALRKNAELVRHVKCANLAAIRMLDEISAVECLVVGESEETSRVGKAGPIAQSTSKLTRQTIRMLCDFKLYVTCHAGQLPRRPSVSDGESLATARGSLRWMFRLADFRERLLKSADGRLATLAPQLTCGEQRACMVFENWRAHRVKIRELAGDAFFDDTFTETIEGRGAMMGCLRGCFICERLWKASKASQNKTRLAELEEENVALAGISRGFWRVPSESESEEISDADNVADVLSKNSYNDTYKPYLPIVENQQHRRFPPHHIFHSLKAKKEDKEKNKKTKKNKKNKKNKNKKNKKKNKKKKNKKEMKETKAKTAKNSDGNESISLVKAIRNHMAEHRSVVPKNTTGLKKMLEERYLRRYGIPLSSAGLSFMMQKATEVLDDDDDGKMDGKIDIELHDKLDEGEAEVGDIEQAGGIKEVTFQTGKSRQWGIACVNADEPGGALVTAVKQDGVTDGYLAVGDVILHVNGQKIADAKVLVNFIHRNVSCNVFRVRLQRKAQGKPAFGKPASEKAVDEVVAAASSRASSRGGKPAFEPRPVREEEQALAGEIQDTMAQQGWSPIKFAKVATDSGVIELSHIDVNMILEPNYAVSTALMNKGRGALAAVRSMIQARREREKEREELRSAFRTIATQQGWTHNTLCQNIGGTGLAKMSLHDLRRILNRRNHIDEALLKKGQAALAVVKRYVSVLAAEFGLEN
jgi:hypothetical protein